MQRLNVETDPELLRRGFQVVRYQRKKFLMGMQCDIPILVEYTASCLATIVTNRDLIPRLNRLSCIQVLESLVI